MSNASDFVIENGVLKKYIGPGGDVVIPAGVTEIGHQAFQMDRKITSVAFPAGLGIIGASAFTYCDMLRAVSFSDGLVLIDREAFKSCKSIEKLELPQGLERIEDYCFAYCSAMKQVIIPDSLCYIGGFTFTKCSALSSITVPNPECSIGGCAFCESGLEEAFIPVRTVPSGFTPGGVFHDCPNLKRVTFTTECGKALAACEDRTFQNTPLLSLRAPLCEISSLAGKSRPFAAAGYAEMVLEEQTLDPSIAAEYEKYIRGQRKKLFSLALKNQQLLRYMIQRALIHLEDVDGLLDECESVEVKAELLAFQQTISTAQKEKLEKKQEKQQAEELGLAPLSVQTAKKSWIFETLESGIRLTKYKGSELAVSVPAQIGKDPVIAIGSDAFASISLSLTAVLVPETVAIESGTFRLCGGLADENGLIIVNGTVYGCVGYDYRGTAGPIIIPEGVTRIDAKAFILGGRITAITIPDSVREIGPEAFHGCEGLADENGFVIVRDTVYDYFGPGGDIELPANVKCIDDHAFAASFTNHVKEIRSLRLPANVEIGEGAFYGCSGLADKDGFVIIQGILCGYFGGKKQVDIPTGISAVGESAFAGNKKIESVTIPEGVIRIEARAFANCTKLNRVDLPQTLEKIGPAAFSEDARLNTIAIPPRISAIEDETFIGCRSLRRLVVPKGVTRIGNGAFKKISIETVLPESVKTIGAYAFGPDPNVRLVGKKGSVAEKYAKEHDCCFIKDT